jgi:hypothetical protein
MDNNISVFIEGDKTKFVSKSAIERFKRDLRSNDSEKLKNNDYFVEGWTYILNSSENNQIKVNVVETETHKDRLNVLREKLKQKITRKPSLSQIRTPLKNKVPDDILQAFINLKKTNNTTPIISPEQILAKPNEYFNMLQTTINNYKGNTNPIINYYKSLMKHLKNIPTIQTPQTLPPQPQPISSERTFIKDLKDQLVMDNEMKDIYNQLGIKQEEEDDEMKRIYESLGISMN